MYQERNFTVKWTPVENEAKDLSIRMKNPMKKRKRNFILEIHDIEELTDLNIQIQFYYGNYLRDSYKCHAFLGEQYCISENPRVQKIVSSFDTEEYFMFNDIKIHIDQKVKMLHFTLK